MLFPLVRAACCDRLLRLAVARSRLGRGARCTRRYCSRSSRGERRMRRPIVARSSPRDRLASGGGPAADQRGGYRREPSKATRSSSASPRMTRGCSAETGRSAITFSRAHRAQRSPVVGAVGACNSARSCPSGLWAARTAVHIRGDGRQRSARGIAVADHHDAARAVHGCASDAGSRVRSESTALRGGQMRRLVTMLR